MALSSMSMTGSMASEVSARVSKPKPAVKVFDAILNWVPRILVVIMPLFFLPWTSEVLEFNKQNLLFISAGILILAYLFRGLLAKEFTCRKSWLNYSILAWFVVLVASAILSKMSYMSWVGDFGQEMSGIATVLSVLIVYFVTANTLKSAVEIKKLWTAVLIGGFVTAIITFLQGVGLFILPFSVAQSSVFNTVGTITSVGVYLVTIFALSSGALLYDHHLGEGSKFKLSNILLAVTAIFSLVVVVIVDFWPVTLSLLIVSLLLIAFSYIHAKSAKNLRGVMLPLVAVVVAVLLFVFNLPNFARFNFPAEVLPTIKSSFSISTQVLTENPVLGTGPGTFVMDYAKYRQQSINNSNFWNVRFDRSGSDVMTMLATTGVLGLLAWLVMVSMILVLAIKTFLHSDERTQHFLVGIIAAWLGLVLGRIFYSSSITLDFLFWMMTAMIVAVVVTNLKTTSFKSAQKMGVATWAVTVVAILLLVIGGVFATKRYSAEVAFAKSVELSRTSPSNSGEVLKLLTKAIKNNPRNDVYLRNLAVVYLSKGQTELSQAVNLKKNDKETEESYKKRVEAANSAKLTLVGTSLANAIGSAKKATEVNPNNVANWAVLGSVYQSMAGVSSGVEGWAIKSYQSAMALEPLNPSYYVEVGKIYLSIYDQLSANTKTITDEKKKAQNAADVKEMIKNAVDAFNKAVALKPDYAPAHYNLAISYDKQGMKKEAIQKLETTIRFSPQDVGVGFQLSLMYFQNNQKTQAISLLERVVALAPNFANARWYLAAMYKDAGDFSKALDQVKEVAKTNPDNKFVKQELEDLTKKSGKAATLLPQPLDESTVNPKEPSVRR